MGPTWRNHSRDQQCRPRAIAHPRSTDELSQLVREAERAGSAVRAVGAGPAWSDVALTDGTLVETDGVGISVAVDLHGSRLSSR